MPHALITLYLFLIVLKVAQPKFNDLKCIAVEPSFGRFAVCEIKAISRNSNAANIRYQLLRTLERIDIHVRIFKRENGWRPFLYNFRIDLCKFYKKPNHPILKIAKDMLRPYINFNHTCPYLAGTDMILHNFDFNIDQFIKKLPIDVGVYRASIDWFERNQLFITTNGSIVYADYRV